MHRRKGVHHASPRPARRFGKRLYLRIWLAVLASLLLAALLAGLAWKFHGNDVPRQISLTDERGVAAGNARIEFRQSQGAPMARVELDDGRVLYARWQGTGQGRNPFGFAGWLLLIVLAVGLGTYPVVRRLTRRLEDLQLGVDALGEGNLAARVPVRGHDEIAWLAERFNHAAARIEALVDSHKSLLANASHELRSPLTRIRMGLELLERDAPGAQGRGMRDEIANSIGELDALIEEILLASRLDARDAPDEPYEELDLTALAAEECARGGAELDAGGVIAVHGSARLLRRVLRNLMENARRHGGATAIDVTLARKPAGVELTVCDRGPGVPPEERERIFEPFYRLRGASESAGGAGLGLALVRTIARKHGGSASCEAREGGGACFRVTLP